MKHKGVHTHRFRDNEEEKNFADAWEDQNKHGNSLAYLLHCGDQQGKPPEPSARDYEVAATVIQWLGSPVGQCFLRDLGYVKRGDNKKPPLILSELEQRVLECIKKGQDTFAQLSTLEAASNFRVVDKAIQRLRRRGLIHFNKKTRSWGIVDEL